MKNLLTGTALKWVLRRMLELGGLFGVIASVLAQVDPDALNEVLGTFGAVLTGNWGEVNLAALVSTATLVGGLIWNALSTFKPHVTKEGERIPIEEIRDVAPAESVDVDRAANKTLRARQAKDLGERLRDAFKRRR